ncbi:MAG: hypothetical protein WCR42_03380 [bacterium]
MRRKNSPQRREDAKKGLGYWVLGMGCHSRESGNLSSIYDTYKEIFTS